MTKQNKIIIAVLIIVLAVVMYFVLRKPAKTNTLTVVDDLPKTNPLVDNEKFPLDIGMRGNNVRSLQRALNWIKPANPILEDGVFGNKTRIKLLTSVNTTLSQIPVSQKNLREIIKLGNKAKMY